MEVGLTWRRWCHFPGTGAESKLDKTSPPAVRELLVQCYQVEKIGQVDEIEEEFYAISVERGISNPVVSMIMESARETLFADFNQAGG